MKYRTEKETIHSMIQNLYLLDNILNNERSDLSGLVNEVPGIFFSNYKGNMDISNLNLEGEEYSQLTREEINQMGFAYYEKFMHPETIVRTGKRFQDFYALADDEKVIGDFQYILNPKVMEYDLFLTISKQFKEHDVLITSSNPIKKIGLLNLKISRLVGEKIFVRENFHLHQSLTPRELHILNLIATGLTNHQISEQLFITQETVKQHRKKIKKKTGCRNIVELLKFAQAFDLV